MTMVAWVSVGSEEPFILAMPLESVAARVLNDFLSDNRERIDALLQPFGVSISQIIQPEWQRGATLADLNLGGNLARHRGELADQIGALNARARREAEFGAMRAQAPFRRTDVESAR